MQKPGGRSGSLEKLEGIRLRLELRVLDETGKWGVAVSGRIPVMEYLGK